MKTREEIEILLEEIREFQRHWLDKISEQTYKDKEDISEIQRCANEANLDEAQIETLEWVLSDEAWNYSSRNL